jgi:hypothetical protein
MKRHSLVIVQVVVSVKSGRLVLANILRRREVTGDLCGTNLMLPNIYPYTSTHHTLLQVQVTVMHMVAT